MPMSPIISVTIDGHRPGSLGGAAGGVGVAGGLVPVPGGVAPLAGGPMLVVGGVVPGGSGSSTVIGVFPG
jgi:hypothetical protein